MYLCVSHYSRSKQIFTLILCVFRAIYIHKQVLLPTNCTTNSTFPHTHTHTHTHTHRGILQHASAIPYSHFLGSVIYKQNTKSRNLTSSTVNGKIHCKYIIILSTGGTYNINRQRLYRTQIKVRRSQTSKADKINLEIAEWLKSLHHEAVCTMDELYVLYSTVQ